MLPGARAAGLLVRGRRIRQALAGHRCPTPVEAWVSWAHRSPPQPRPGPPPDPPPPHGLRDLPQRATGDGGLGRGTSTISRASWGTHNRITDDEEFEQWFCTARAASKATGDRRRADPGALEGRLYLTLRGAAYSAITPGSVTCATGRSTRRPTTRPALAAGCAEPRRWTRESPLLAPPRAPPRRSAARTTRRGHGSEYISLNYPDFDLCAPLPRSARFDVVICEQVLEHVVGSVGGRGQPEGALRTGRPGDRLDPFPRQGPRAPAVRDVRLLALHAARPADAARGAPASRSRRSIRGATARRWSGTSATGRPDRPWHSLRDEPDVPLQVWAFARNLPATAELGACARRPKRRAQRRIGCSTKRADR